MFTCVPPSSTGNKFIDEDILGVIVPSNEYTPGDFCAEEKIPFRQELKIQLGELIRIR